MSAFVGERSRRRTQFFQRQGFDVDMAELVYHGERSRVSDYLAADGWQVRVHDMPELYAAYDFEGSPATAPAFGDVVYIDASRP
jgi:O-methyltransferase involved in polyketide biosynthesis